VTVRITCIRKAGGDHYDPHIAISNLGWVNDGTGENGSSTREQLYDWLRNHNGVAYVLDRWGNKAFVYPRENASGTRFVQTYADNVWTDNLLALPECRS
jgi:Protein of unknown function (DUF3892)